jgi:hypothetical protein
MVKDTYLCEAPKRLALENHHYEWRGDGTANQGEGS